MTSATYFPATKPAWFANTEGWLDRRGRPAWIALMVAGFVAFWPVGLAILAYMVVTRRFSITGSGSERTAMPMGGSGNAAFDAYRAETLRRLEEEQDAFKAFLDRLREARDKAEFDQFMEEQSRRKGERKEPETTEIAAA